MGPYCALDPAAYFKVFMKLCREDGLLERPKDLGPKDECHGFTDTSTLLYILPVFLACTQNLLNHSSLIVIY
jgi:hypothetical protein